MTYMAGKRGHMIDHDVCLVVQDIRDITHPILSEIRFRSWTDEQERLLGRAMCTKTVEADGGVCC